MKTNEGLSRLRQVANQFIKERTRQEDVAFRRTPMVAASFIRKASGACYLSASIKGESRHRYVRKADEEYWKKRARQWREFSKAMAKWVRLNKEIEIKLRQIGRLRCESLPKGIKGDRDGSS